MANLEFTSNVRFHWWIKCFSSSKKSWHIANEFVNSLKCDKVFTHNGEYGATSATFLCYCAKEKVVTSLPIDGKDEGCIILTDTMGKLINVKKNVNGVYLIKGTTNELRIVLEDLINGMSI